MAKFLRVTMFFQDDESGWSETHYSPLGSDLGLELIKAVNVLAPARRQLLASGPWLKYIRVSFDDTWRDAQVQALPKPVTAGGKNLMQFQNNPDWKGFSAAEPWTTVLLRGENGDLYRKQIYISGIPTPDPTDIGAPTDDPVLVAAFQNYVSVLTANYGFPLWQRDQATFPWFPITTMVNNAGQNTGVVITAPGLNIPFPVPPYTRIWLHNVKFGPTKPPGLSFNGPFTITAAAEGGNYILGLMNQIPQGYTFRSGIAQQQQRAVLPYTALVMERFTHRKRGRPFDVPRGRSRKAVGYSVAR